MFDDPPVVEEEIELTRGRALAREEAVGVRRDREDVGEVEVEVRAWVGDVEEEEGRGLRDDVGESFWVVGKVVRVRLCVGEVDFRGVEVEDEGLGKGFEIEFEEGG